MPANLVFRRKIWGARDNGIPPRSTPANVESHVFTPNNVPGRGSVPRLPA